MKINKETKAYRIAGRGSWSVVDSVDIDGHSFFLMRNDKHGDRLEKIVMDDSANIIIDNDEDGLDPYIVDCIRQYLHSGRVSVRDRLKAYQRGGGA